MIFSDIFEVIGWMLFSLIEILLEFFLPILIILAFVLNKKRVEFINDLNSNTLSQNIGIEVKKNISSIEQMHFDHIGHEGGMHEDHTIIKTKHDPNKAFRSNNEKDQVKDKKLSEAERNVLYGK